MIEHLELPKFVLDPEVAHDLASVCAITPAQVIERTLTGLKPCGLLKSRRVGEFPLWRHGISALLRRPTSDPVLPMMNSKFGGIPYDEGSSWIGYSFLGQLNFSSFNAKPLGFPDDGILGIDFGAELFDFRLRWYPAPDKKRAKSVTVPSVGHYECAISYFPEWSLPSTDNEFLELYEGFPQAALDVLIDWLPEQIAMDDGGHRLGGWRSAGLFDHYGFTPPINAPPNLDDWTMVLRLDFDNEADFGWGSNVVYVIAPTVDFEQSDFSNAIVVGANF